MLEGLESTSSLAEVQDILRSVKRSAARAPALAVAVPLPEYEPMNRASAVIIYADQVSYAWVIAVAIDSLVLTLLLLLLLATHLRLVDPVPIPELAPITPPAPSPPDAQVPAKRPSYDGAPARIVQTN